MTSLSLPLPRHRLDGCACTSPLAHFYIHHSDSSTRELHPFTTITHLASQNAITPKTKDDLNIQFLFRKRGRPTDPVPARKDGFVAALSLLSTRKKPKLQWTNRLAGLVDDPKPTSNTATPSTITTDAQSKPTADLTASEQSKTQRTVDVPLRLEGPYFTPVDPARYQTVVCFVAGTGLSGAIAIANAFTELERERASQHKFPSDTAVDGTLHPFQGQPTQTWQRCVVVWSVREEDYVALPFLQGTTPSQSQMPITTRQFLTPSHSDLSPLITDFVFVSIVHPASNLQVQTHLTGNGRPRLDVAQTLEAIRADGDPKAVDSVWVYISGPNKFIEAGERACKAAAAASGGIEWYGARWDI